MRAAVSVQSRRLSLSLWCLKLPASITASFSVGTLTRAQDFKNPYLGHCDTVLSHKPCSHSNRNKPCFLHSFPKKVLRDKCIAALSFRASALYAFGAVAAAWSKVSF